MTKRRNCCHWIKPIDVAEVTKEDTIKDGFHYNEVWRNYLDDWEDRMTNNGERTIIAFNAVPIVENGTTVAIFLSMLIEGEDY